MTEEDQKDESQVEESFDGLVFEEEPESKPVRIKDRNGNVHNYVLREMSGAALGRWQSYDASRMKLVRNRLEMAPDAFKEYAATLISLNLLDETNQHVPVQTILRWKSSIITGLFDECQRMNGLTADSREQAKKV